MSVNLCEISMHYWSILFTISGGLGLKNFDSCFMGEEMAYACSGISTALGANSLGVRDILYSRRIGLCLYTVAYYVKLHIRCFKLNT